MSEKVSSTNIARQPFWFAHPRITHAIIFAAVWIVVFAMPWLGMSVVIASDSAAGVEIVRRSWSGLLPYLVVSLINEFILIPAFLNRRRMPLYIVCVAVVLGLFTIYQNHLFEACRSAFGHSLFPLPDSEPIHINLPVLRRLAMATLIVGCGLGYHANADYRRRLRRARDLERERLTQELTGLRAQISPHFFMNTLNNIHSVMETDVDKAQKMILRLSRMMRYVTYDTRLDHVPLSWEISFIRSYIDLMSMRYPAERVRIATDFPSERTAAMFSVPPMIFITFAENAFKHGITYRHPTQISISMTLTPSQRLVFTCVNTLPDADSTDKSGMVATTGGVGLKNVRRRLEMLYGSDFSLTAAPDPTTHTYIVELDLPAHETEMHRH